MNNKKISFKELLCCFYNLYEKSPGKGGRGSTQLLVNLLKLNITFFRHHSLPASLFRAKPFSSPYSSVSVTQAHSFSDLTVLAFPMLRYLGCHLLCDASLTTKVVRLIKSFINLVSCMLL